ncbi:hypothetical protein [Dyella subtropica]|uniref:hypothetical protein n=1 Tax=Dyella subtropica TaxID=2992127 RepID=UPI0022510890|nr:hypothetical protein [Dyella subtropica]
MPQSDMAGGLAWLQDIRTAYPLFPSVVTTTTGEPAIYHAMLSTDVNALISKSDDIKEI